MINKWSESSFNVESSDTESIQELPQEEDKKSSKELGISKTIKAPINTLQIENPKRTKPTAFKQRSYNRQSLKTSQELRGYQSKNTSKRRKKSKAKPSSHQEFINFLQNMQGLIFDKIKEEGKQFAKVGLGHAPRSNSQASNFSSTKPNST